MTKTTVSTKKQQLDELAASIVSNQVCPQLAAAATQLVMGEGNPNADIVLVGEAPGKEEDRQGKPFVGAAGKFLNQLLRSIGMARGDVYITNIVKYRPPNNRDPAQAEIEAFKPYLLKQLAIIKPKLVASLGRHAMGVLLPGLRISQCHGQPKRIRVKGSGFRMQDNQKSKIGNQQSEMSLVILPLYHPAVALYNAGMRSVLEADFAKIPTIITLIKQIKPKARSKV